MTFRRFDINPIRGENITPLYIMEYYGEYGKDPYDPSCYQLGRQNKYARDSAYSE